MDRKDYGPGSGKILDRDNIEFDLTQYHKNVARTYTGVPDLQFLNVDERQHVLIEKGEYFTSNSSIVVATGVPKYAQVKTGAKQVSYKPTNYYSVGENVLVEFFENSTISVDGPLPGNLRNRNRNSAKVALTQVLLDPTVTSDGDRLDVRLVSSGGAVSKVLSFEGGSNTEWVLEPNTSYIFKYTNLGNANTTLHISNLINEEDVS